jgi:hypothetical protein
MTTEISSPTAQFSHQAIRRRPRRSVNAPAKGAWKWLALSMISAGIFVSACSPYVYGREVGAFSSSVQATSSSFQSARADAAAARNAALRTEWVTRRAQLAISPECQIAPDSVATPALPTLVATTANDTCHLLEPGATLPQPDQAEKEAATAQPIAEALSAYAAALTAITTAQDRTDFDAAVGKLTDAVNGLAPDSSHAKIAASSGFLTSLFGAALDARRLTALRSAVDQAQGLLEVLAPTLGLALDALRMDSASRHNDEIARLLTALGQPHLSEADYSARLTALQTEVAALETLRAAHPRQAAQRLVAAHDALRRALHSDARQAEAVMTALQQFADEAGKLRDAFK